MLKSLQIKNILIIDQLELNFEPGLNVLTGETGAGKSILLDSLGFVLGKRGQMNLVRSGAQQGEVNVEFYLEKSHRVWKTLKLAGFEIDGELLIRRVVSSEGRKQAFVNDKRVTSDFLRSFSEGLIEFNGQNDDKGLLNRRNHQSYLDSFLGLETISLAKLWRSITDKKSELDKIRDNALSSIVDREFVQYSLKELEDVALIPQEEVHLDQRRKVMKESEGIRENLSKLLYNLIDEGAEKKIANSIKALHKLKENFFSELDLAVSALERSYNELGEATEIIQKLYDSSKFSLSELEETEDRLFLLRGLARKHQVDVSSLIDLREEFKVKIESWANSEDLVTSAEEKLNKLFDEYKRRAKILSNKRICGARELDKSVQKELKPLNLEYAKFKTEVSSKSSGPEGNDNISFTVSTNAGAIYGPLNQIASGGELSRFTLALKVCLSEKKDKSSMVFDEIDSGVGGKTADAIGRRLLEISKNGQVLAVTHSPQVAALADLHVLVQKEVVDSETFCSVDSLVPSKRVEEVARMLSGSKLTDEAREMAKVLIGDTLN